MAAARPRLSAGRETSDERAMEAAGGEQRELLIQRLRAAVHYTTGCLCQGVAEDKGVLFSKQTVAAISEITFRQCENFARDLEMFARYVAGHCEGIFALARITASHAGRDLKDHRVQLLSPSDHPNIRHAKRSTITSEDVKLLARRSNSLLKYITQKSEELASSNMEQKEKKKKKSSAAKGKRTEENETPVTESEDSNMA